MEKEFCFGKNSYQQMLPPMFCSKAPGKKRVIGPNRSTLSQLMTVQLLNRKLTILPNSRSANKRAEHG